LPATWLRAGIGGLGHLGFNRAEVGYEVAAIGRGSENSALAKKLGRACNRQPSDERSRGIAKLGGAKIIWLRLKLKSNV